MLHGLHLAGQGLDGDHIDAALIGALMHDVGYLMSDEEASGTGAQFTASHVMRGVEFTRRHLADLPAEVLEATTKVIMLTDHRKHPDWVTFDNLQQQRAAYATATADLIGQMANREYLERRAAAVFRIRGSPDGRLRRHPRPAGKDHGLLPHDQGAPGPGPERLSACLARHFAEQQGTERNFYQESIDRNLDYLDQRGQDRARTPLERLKRGGVVEKVLELGKGRLKWSASRFPSMPNWPPSSTG
jgi:hypothetical protein